MIIFGYLFSALYGVACLALAFLAARLGVAKKYTRKIVHILVGFEWVILNAFFGPGVHFLAVCLGFTALLAVSYGKRLLPMISSDADNAPGTVYYGVSMSIMAAVSLAVPEFVYPFGIAVFSTSFGDGLAGVLGTLAHKRNPAIYRGKTLVGTLACALFSSLSAAAMSLAFSLELSGLSIVLIGILAAGLELISTKGLDNILLPLGVSAFSYLLLAGNAYDYALPIVLTPLVIVLALKKELLTPGGVFAAIVLDVAVSLAFANFGFVYLLSFLLLTAVVDKLKGRYKKSAEGIDRTSEKRGASQVMANGAVPMLLALLYLVFPSELLVAAYVAALAECFADSCASGVGVLSSRTYDIIKLKRMPVGLSGGVSIPGTLAALVASFAFPLIALAFGAINGKGYVLAASISFLGCVLDSILGSLLQVKYKCKRCGALTECREHCGASAVRHSGFEAVDNDMVNVISVSISAAAAFFLSLVL